MIRRTQGAFRTNGARLNLEDLNYVAVAQPVLGQYTAGATLLDRVTLFPATSDDCQVMSFTVSAKLAIGTNFDNQNRPPAGRLGKVIAGLTTQDAPTGPPAGYAQTVLPLPADLTLTSELWNPAADELPPLFSMLAASNPITGGFTPPGLIVGTTQTLPAPLPIFQGQDLCIGIWKLPSIVDADTTGNLSLVFGVFDALWSLVYDDGQR